MSEILRTLDAPIRMRRSATRCPNDQAAQSSGLKPLSNQVLSRVDRGNYNAIPEIDLARRTWQVSKTWQTVLSGFMSERPCVSGFDKFRPENRYRALPQKWYGMVTS
jgi:hypothetical protein